MAMSLSLRAQKSAGVPVSDILLTAAAPAIWGTTYLVTTELLPQGYPVTMAMLRALPAGLLLLVLVRRIPRRGQIGQVFLLGAANFSVFWICLFVAAYRLPGGVAAIVGAIQPLLVVFMARAWLGSPIRMLAVIAALTGIAGVAMLVLSPAAALDPVGIIAGLAGAVSMGAGTVLSRKWRGNVPLLTFTAWQLTAGGLLLLPLALVVEPDWPAIDADALGGLVWLGLIGSALTYAVWFRGVARLDPSSVAPLGFVSPIVAVTLGWILLGQSLNSVQMAGILVVLASVWAGQHKPSSRSKG